MNNKQYDKILKENIEQIFLPLAEKYLGIKIIETKDLPEKLQITREREADFNKIVFTDKGETFILHIEFQTADDAEMVYRMADYKAMMMRKFKIAVKSFVLYLGIKKPKMRTKLIGDEIIKGFDLVNIHDLDTEQILGSEVPEEIILAILGDYKRERAGAVIARIIERLRELCRDEVRLQKYIQQLIVLSRLRNLEVETKNKVEHMPITYDIKKDGLFLEGKKEGKKQGRKEGMMLTAENLLKRGMTIQEVSEITTLSVEELNKIFEKLKKGQK